MKLPQGDSYLQVDYLRFREFVHFAGVKVCYFGNCDSNKLQYQINTVNIHVHVSLTDSYSFTVEHGRGLSMIIESFAQIFVQTHAMSRRFITRGSIRTDIDFTISSVYYVCKSANEQTCYAKTGMYSIHYV